MAYSANLLEVAWRGVPGLPDATGRSGRIYSQGEEVAHKGAIRKAVAPRRDAGSDFVEALAHGLAVLECWRGVEVWLTNSELAARSGLARPTVSRLTSVLVDLGYLVRDDGRRGRLRLSTSTLGLGFGSTFSALPVSASHPELVRLAQDLDVYTALSIRRFDKVQILENVASPFHPNAVVNDVGALLPMCRSASGFAALSSLPDPEAVPLIRRLSIHYGERWGELERQLDRTRQEYSHRGYCTSVATLSRNVAAIAVPIVPAGAGDVFVLACGMSTRDFYPERVERDIAPRMLKVVDLLLSSLSA